nr:Homeobox protein yox1 [Exophiala xenobiotica]
MDEDARGATCTPHHSDVQPHYAFEVEDQSMLSSRSSVPTSESNSAAKAKRKRTSPQDHAVLETAYLKNSKPDKAERVQIIWFQNRRQNDRRRSKPLQPHELVAHLHTRTASPMPLQVNSPAAREQTSPSLTRSNPLLAPSDVIPRPASRASSIRDLLNPASSADIDSSQEEALHGSQETTTRSTPPSSFGEPLAVTTKNAADANVEPQASKSDDKAENTDNEPGSAKKRGHDEMTGADTPTPNGAGQEQEAPPPRTKEPLARSSSMMRLSMTVDGAVKVRTDNEPTPSPEKPRAAPIPASQAKAKSGLMRSKSAMTSVEIFQDPGQAAHSKAREPGFGRSRDARTWEFYCDTNTKDALSTQAEAETAGSAVSAINLIRTNSLKSRSQPFSPSLTKTNSRVGMVSKGGKPKLSRAQSSLGRLQGLDAGTQSSVKKPKVASHARSPSDDSDKENWAPGTRLSENPLRRTEPSARQRPILQEDEEMTFPNATSSRKRREAETNNHQSPTKEKAKGDDLDCVKSLLSLSQGAWR